MDHVSIILYIFSHKSPNDLNNSTVPCHEYIMAACPTVIDGIYISAGCYARAECVLYSVSLTGTPVGKMFAL